MSETPEEKARREADEYLKQAREAALASTVKLSDLITDDVGDITLTDPETGESRLVKLPKVTQTAFVLLEEELGKIDGVEVGNIKNLGIMLWALLNQHNLDVVSWGDIERKQSIMKVTSEIVKDDMQDIISKIMDAYATGGTGKVNPASIAKKKSPRKTKRT